MKKKKRKAFKEKIIIAVKKTLKDNDTVLTDKIEKVVKKSIKQIINKSSKKTIVKKKPSGKKT